MPDVYVHTERRGFGRGLVDSVVGVLVGVVLFFASFFIIGWTETSVDESRIVLSALAVDAAAPPPEAGGQAVKLSGKAEVEGPVADPDYLPGRSLIYVERTAEMYAWDEDEETETEGDRKKTTYTYDEEWTSSPADSSRFKHPSGHHNPPQTIRGLEERCEGLVLGRLRVSGGEARFLLARDVQRSEAGAGARPWFVSRDGNSTEGSPRVGDERVRLRAVDTGADLFICGALSGDAVRPLTHRRGSFLVVSPAPEGEVVRELAFEHAMVVWTGRVGGFLAMLVGMALMAGPLTYVLGFIPVAGKAGGCLLHGVFALIALALTTATVLLVQFFWVLVALSLVAVLVGVVRWGRARRAPAPAA